MDQEQLLKMQMMLPTVIGIFTNSIKDVDIMTITDEEIDSRVEKSIKIASRIIEKL